MFSINKNSSSHTDGNKGIVATGTRHDDHTLGRNANRTTNDPQRRRPRSLSGKFEAQQGQSCYVFAGFNDWFPAIFELFCGCFRVVFGAVYLVLMEKTEPLFMEKMLDDEDLVVLGVCKLF